MKKSIGILYICTGPYVLFWKDFYKSFQEKFLVDFEKRYFVFSDAEEIYGQDDPDVKKIKIEPQPWPLITLLRFSTFLKVEEKLKKCDYLMFSNSNMVCDAVITPEEFLPREKLNETLAVTIHPGYAGKKKIDFPYDRNKKSTAYIPWNCGSYYVIGAMFCGTSNAFIKMSKTLKKNIEEDLKRNIIAKWHDESQLNRYIIGKKNIRILPPQYCYPCGMNVTYAKKISAVNKEAKFDVNTFKGQYKKQSSSLRTFVGKIKRELILKEHVLYFIDCIKCSKLGEVKDAE